MLDPDSDHYHRTIPPLAEPLKEKLTAKMVTLQNHYGPKLKQVAVRRGQVPSRRARLLEVRVILFLHSIHCYPLFLSFWHR
jgi:hypothetical protein